MSEWLNPYPSLPVFWVKLTLFKYMVRTLFFFLFCPFICFVSSFVPSVLFIPQCRFSFPFPLTTAICFPFIFLYEIQVSMCDVFLHMRVTYTCERNNTEYMQAKELILLKITVSSKNLPLQFTGNLSGSRRTFVYQLKMVYLLNVWYISNFMDS